MQSTRHQNDRKVVHTCARAHTHTHTHKSQYVKTKICLYYGIKRHTDTEVKANTPDIIIKDKKKKKNEKTCILIDVAIPVNIDVMQKENSSHWNSNKRFKEKFGNHNRKIFSIFTKKTAIPRTSHKICKVLQSHTCSLSSGDHHWLKSRSTREKRSVTRETITMMKKTTTLTTLMIMIMMNE
jgi:hypothetical protein